MPRLSPLRVLAILTAFLAIGQDLLSAEIFRTRKSRPVTSARAPRVLFLGDSMSMGAFGKTVDAKLRAAGYDVYTYVAGGATPYYWLSRYAPIASDIGFWKKTPSGEQRVRTVKAVPKVEPLIEACNPDIVVIQTGVNLYSTLRSKRRTREGNVEEVESLCRNMASAVTQGGRRCYWIAPPQSHAERYPVELQKEMGSLMKRVVGRYGRVFDSRKVTKFTDPYPKTDGIHYGPTEARQWANHVASDLLRYASSEGMGRRALDPHESFGREVAVVKRATPVDPGKIVWGEIDVTLRLKKRTVLPHKSDVTYRNCGLLYEYDVVRVHRGHYPYDTLRVLHLGMFNKKPTAKVAYSIGSVKSWKMMPIEAYSFFQRLQTFDDLKPDLDKPVYVIKQD